MFKGVFKRTFKGFKKAFQRSFTGLSILDFQFVDVGSLGRGSQHNEGTLQIDLHDICALLPQPIWFTLPPPSAELTLSLGILVLIFLCGWYLPSGLHFTGWTAQL